ncbi:4HBT domain-containing protein [Mycena indigotica]|uniref:4HBT domain-containing protein n=1 Tax=Mycena indigotica TaxID=2126181 RepID=A0A8H6SEC2_9AGAR|nr:4HBT domain-containing protein [Mycena indigotica]KAF7297176.1 4HBT domain-containing protein [Mycena indigotica]
MTIAGNADDSLKEMFSDLKKLLGTSSDTPAFGDEIVSRMKVTHASIDQKLEEPNKTEGKIVVELEVAEDMLNGWRSSWHLLYHAELLNGAGSVHGGCSAFLIDLCSSLSLMLIDPGLTVSQSLNIVYHSPANLGEKLRIVNTTITVGSRIMSARVEIWNATKHRLVASGVHIKMQPSPSSKL